MKEPLQRFLPAALRFAAVIENDPPGHLEFRPASELLDPKDVVAKGVYSAVMLTDWDQEDAARTFVALAQYRDELARRVFGWRPPIGSDAVLVPGSGALANAEAFDAIDAARAQQLEREAGAEVREMVAGFVDALIG